MWNEAAGWSAVLAGILMGLYMGVRFRSEDWLGGYGSLPRRMVRMAHVACVALGLLNIIASDSLSENLLSPALTQVASWTLIGSAVLMPVCCLVIAGGYRRFEIFLAPVATLLTAVILLIEGSIQ